MNQENESSDCRPASAGFFKGDLPTQFTPYENSLIGEYARLFLLLLTLPVVLLFAFAATKHPSGVLFLIAASVLLTSLVTPRGYRGLRVGLLVAMAMNVFAMAINPAETFSKIAQAPPPLVTKVLLFCLITASGFEICAWVRSSSWKTLTKTMGWGVLAIPALAYIAGVPVFEFCWKAIEIDDTKNALKDPDWNLLNEMAFRSAKFLVFATFTYLGACLGSFLNVVAHCVPRGQALGLRDSKCPQCSSKLRRIDNLPVFSYINLGAKCRSCRAPIAARYLIFELVVAFIFGSLFLYELVTGGANVPGMKLHHTGILWIILYPKWHVIGIYFYHVLLMCAVLVLSMMEWDKQPLKLGFSIVVGLSFFVTAAIYFPLQPIPLLEHIPSGALALPPWAAQLAKLTIGAVTGGAIGRLLSNVFSASHCSVLTCAFAIAGIVLGWQALLQVTVIFLILTAFTAVLPSGKSMRSRPTTILFVAAMLHHPLWKLIANEWKW